MQKTAWNIEMQIKGWQEVLVDNYLLEIQPKIHSQINFQICCHVMEETNNIRIVTLDHLQHTFGSQFVAVALDQH